MATFTARFPTIVDAVTTEAVVFQPSGSVPTCAPVRVSALWDTGAAFSVIGEKIINALNLVPYNLIDAYGVNGSFKANAYLVDLMLPNGVKIQNLTVSQGELCAADMLIGMDVMRYGDVAISNDGHTTFSLRMPSHGEIDFSNSKPIS